MKRRGKRVQFCLVGRLPVNFWTFALVFYYFLFKFLFWLIKKLFNFICRLVNRKDVEQEENIGDDLEEDEIPFCQLFNIDEDTVLLVDHVEYCPEETAFIRVVKDSGYTKLYRKRVQKSKLGERFIVYDKKNMWLNEKTLPVVPPKEI